MPTKHLIVGVDPGSTIGLAAVDLSGVVQHTSHTKDGFEGAVQIIERWGTPSLIAVDVRPAPSFATRMAAAFNVPLFTPLRPWREEEKSSLLKHLNIPAENAHERDALSAAILAFRTNQNTLTQGLGATPLTNEQKDKLRHLLLQGIRQSVAIEMLKEKTESKESKIPPQKISEALPSPAKHLPSNPKQNDALISLERANSELRKRIAFVESERDTLRAKIRTLENSASREMLRDRLVNRLQYEVSRLKSEIENIRRPKKTKGKSEPSRRIQLPPKTHSSRMPQEMGEREAGLKTLDERQIDIERIIREYRKGRTGE